MNRYNKTSGFTLIEIIVVIAIIGALTAIAVPVYTRYVADAKRVVCRSNRITMLHEFAYVKMIDSEATFADFQADGGDFFICPESGSFSINETETYIACSKHSFLDGTQGAEDSFPETGEGGDGGHTIGGIPISPSGSWGELMERLKDLLYGDVGEHLAPGIVFADETGIYVSSDQNPYITKSIAESGITLAEYSAQNPDKIVKINEERVLTVNDNNEGRWNTPPQRGDIYEFNGELYMCMYPSGVWTATNPSESTVWIKLTGQV